jgi:hypothetical protein
MENRVELVESPHPNGEADLGRYFPDLAYSL